MIALLDYLTFVFKVIIQMCNCFVFLPIARLNLKDCQIIRNTTLIVIGQSYPSNTQQTMAFPTVDIVVAKIIMETKMKVIEDMIAFIDTKVELDDEMIELFSKFKESLKLSEEENIKKTLKKEKKKKRPPSVYNLFIKDQIANFKKIHPDKNGMQLMALAVKQWKTYPKHIMNKIVELKKSNKSYSNEKIYEVAKSLYNKI